MIVGVIIVLVVVIVGGNFIVDLVLLWVDLCIDVKK